MAWLLLCSPMEHEASWTEHWRDSVSPSLGPHNHSPWPLRFQNLQSFSVTFSSISDQLLILGISSTSIFHLSTFTILFYLSHSLAPQSLFPAHRANCWVHRLNRNTHGGQKRAFRFHASLQHVPWHTGFSETQLQPQDMVCSKGKSS